MTQDETIQIKVSPKFKNILKNVAEARGLPLSTYVKFVLSEHFKEDPLWNTLEAREEQLQHVEDFIKDVRKMKRAKKK